MEKLFKETRRFLSYAYNITTFEDIKQEKELGFKVMQASKLPKHSKIGSSRSNSEEKQYLSSLPAERFSKIQLQSKANYRKSGYKTTEVLLAMQRESISPLIFYFIVIDLGIRKLYSKDTASKAKKVVERLLPDHYYYWKCERNNSRDSCIHIHALCLLSESFIFPGSIDGLSVSYKRLGEGKKYADKSLFENARDSIVYLLDAHDSRADRKKPGKPSFRNELYKDWFLDSWQKHENEQAKIEKRRANIIIKKSELWEDGAILRGASKALRNDIRGYSAYFQQYSQVEIESRYTETKLQDTLYTAILKKNIPFPRRTIPKPRSIFQIVHSSGYIFSMPP